MDWSLFATILKIVLCLAALGFMSWLFSCLEEFLAITITLLFLYGGGWICYLLFRHIHETALRLGI
jgi:hypothetical protein